MEHADFTEHNVVTAMLEHADVKMFWKDCQRRFVGASQSFLDFYSLKREDIIGKTDEDMGWHIDPEPYMCDEYDIIEKGKKIYDSPGKCIIRGKVRHIMATKLPIEDDNGAIVGLVGYFRDVTDQKIDKDRLITKANTDELTQLVNRRGMMEAVKEYVSEYEKRGIDFAVIVLDVNNFRELNSTHGHGFGDKYLQTIADELLEIAGNTSVVARLGGDYFIILRQIPLRDIPSEVSKTVLNLLEKIRQKQTQVRMIEGHSFRNGVAVGWAAYSEFEDLEKTINSADMRMYKDKESDF